MCGGRMTANSIVKLHRDFTATPTTCGCVSESFRASTVARKNGTHQKPSPNHHSMVRGVSWQASHNRRFERRYCGWLLSLAGNNARTSRKDSRRENRQQSAELPVCVLAMVRTKRDRRYLAGRCRIAGAAKESRGMASQGIGGVVSRLPEFGDEASSRCSLRSTSVLLVDGNAQDLVGHWRENHGDTCNRNAMDQFRNRCVAYSRCCPEGKEKSSDLSAKKENASQRNNDVGATAKISFRLGPGHGYFLYPLHRPTEASRTSNRIQMQASEDATIFRYPSGSGWWKRNRSPRPFPPQHNQGELS
jgi:hypothetical protein